MRRGATRYKLLLQGRTNFGAAVAFSVALAAQVGVNLLYEKNNSDFRNDADRVYVPG